MAVLGELLPEGFEYGTNYLVEYDPSSLWYETSLTMAAQALQHGVKCEYHVLQHPPNETQGLMDGLGLQTTRLIGQDRLRIIDYYTPSTKLGKGEDVRHSESWKTRTAFNLKVWGEDTRREILAGITPADKRWLHIDDNFSVLLQLFKEDDILDFYRTTLIAWTRARELLMFSSLVTGVASSAFYRKFESLCDGIIDFESREEGGEIRQYVRIRKVWGKSFQSQWRGIRLQEDGRVSLTAVPRAQEFRFKERAVGKVFDFLVVEFIDDFMKRNINSDGSGWRTLMEIAKGTGISASKLYRQFEGSGQLFRELNGRGLLETKLFLGERGRGGAITRIRVAYGKEPIRRLVDERVKAAPGKLHGTSYDLF